MSYEGMPLRDWFAGQALVLLKHATCSNAELAHHAYEVADAMMAARKASNLEQKLRDSIALENSRSIGPK